MSISERLRQRSNYETDYLGSSVGTALCQPRPAQGTRQIGGRLAEGVQSPLNSIRSEENVNKKIKELSEDKKHARKLVQAAVLLLPKKEDTTFTYSGAHILGTLAQDAREIKAAIEFHLIAIEKANKVKSVRKLAWSRFNLVEAYLADNRADDAEKVAKKLLSTNPTNIEEQEDLQALGITKFLANIELVRIYNQQGKNDEAQKQIDSLYKMVDQGSDGLK